MGAITLIIAIAALAISIVTFAAAFARNIMQDDDIREIMRRDGTKSEI